MRFYKISEFASLIGVTTVTLRNWETKGILIPHHRSPTGYRYYSDEQLSTYLSGKVIKKEVIPDVRSQQV